MTDDKFTVGIHTVGGLEERLEAYSIPTEHGFVVDVAGMVLDLITVLKAAGETRETFLKNVTEMWDGIEANIKVSKDSTN